MDGTRRSQKQNCKQGANHGQSNMLYVPRSYYFPSSLWQSSSPPGVGRLVQRRQNQAGWIRRCSLLPQEARRHGHQRVDPGDVTLDVARSAAIFQVRDAEGKTHPPGVVENRREVLLDEYFHDVRWTFAEGGTAAVEAICFCGTLLIRGQRLDPRRPNRGPHQHRVGLLRWYDRRSTHRYRRHRQHLAMCRIGGVWD